ncbi:DNA repair protein RAD16-like [Iris pallida]|uniref:DNA repair protein RAD16-like n=1 Tax=Iris pallida TaxID=29817 RepID=A0AAX6DPY5_IRIPA|nr:DNA repair protein RAD16-like [Iris pallida]
MARSRSKGSKPPRKVDDFSDSGDSDYVASEPENFIDIDEDEVDWEILPAGAAAAPPPSPRKRRRGGRKDADPKLRWKVWEAENNRWIDEHMLDPDEPEDRVLQELAEPCPEITLPLLRFQKEWIAWALRQEASETRGGILADEMGMGKTIQAISLVLTARSLGRAAEPKADVPSCSSALPRTGATLVICPVVAVIQWAGEIDKHVEKGKARVLVYHGPKRGLGRYDFRDYDFVLTTYSTIEGDYRRNVMPPKEECEFCGKKFNEKRMKVHLLYYCGPEARRTEAQAKQEKKRKDVPKKIEELDDDDDNDDEDRKGQGKGKGKKKGVEKKKGKLEEQAVRGDSPLHLVKWERIILDEAHFIKDRRSNTARAVFALDSVYKWALSGTPLQNRVGELYSLVRFLQIYPYSCYFCRDCDCHIFDYTVTGDCINCPHASVRHFCWWNRYINRPVQNGVPYESKRAMALLRKRVLKSVVLRRTKKGRAADLALPPRIVSLRRDSLDKNEQEFYEALYTQSQVKFTGYVGAGTLMNNYAHIFDLLTRLRQAVDHPYLVVYSKTAEVPDGATEDNPIGDCGVGAKEDNPIGDCGICHEPVEDVVVTSCDHTFCKACLIDYSASLGNVSCPSCSKPLTVDLTTNVSEENSDKYTAAAIKGYKRSGILSRVKKSEFKTSTKIDALREEIRNMVENDSSAKGIVFSQFTSFLDLINYSLQLSGVKCIQLVGSMTLSERERAIKAFTEDGDCRIFLMSLKAGGVALNLTVASHVFLMDPWWNPAVERQAQDRIHRIGQYKPIRTVRFVIEDTVEERILQLQEKKQLVFEGTVGDSKDAMAKLTEADLRFLFQI